MKLSGLTVLLTQTLKVCHEDIHFVCCICVDEIISDEPSEPSCVGLSSLIINSMKNNGSSKNEFTDKMQLFFIGKLVSPVFFLFLHREIS